MNQNNEEKILKDLERGYDEMAEKFSETRKYFWRDFEFIQDCAKDGDRIFDFGCGNGRLLEILKNKNVEYYGADISQKLIELAKQKYQSNRINFQKLSGSSSLTFPDNFFNIIFSLAVFHHFPKKYSEKMAKELFRIMKPNGMIIVSAWNLWQKRFWRNIFGASVILGKIFQIGKYQGLGFKDLLIPFKNNNQERIFYRYHYAYTKKELENILVRAGFKIEKSLVLNDKNIIILGRK